MIAFASLFLGLVTGVLPVTVMVADPVVLVRFDLDGKEIGQAEKRPWSIRVNLGDELAPHELVARAFDRKGQEIGLARQWLNLPRPPAEVEILVERDRKGRATGARLFWESKFGPQPVRFTVAFDGQALPVSEARRVLLPDFDQKSTHLLTAELEFPGNIRSRADLVLGGGSASETKSELTAVPVALRKGRPLPSVEELQGRFWNKGRPLAVVALENGGADVILVREPETALAIRQLGDGGRSMRLGLVPRYEPEALRYAMPLGKLDRIKLVWPLAHSRDAYEYFDYSQDFTARDGGLHWLLTRIDCAVTGLPQRHFATAVAVAGLQAFAGHSRRAVVLVLGDSDHDESRYSPHVVRRYLERLHVPLYVWSLEDQKRRPATAEWGAVEEVSSVEKLERAVRQLRQGLEKQHVAWLEGRHLPQDIALSEKAQGIELVR